MQSRYPIHLKKNMKKKEKPEKKENNKEKNTKIKKKSKEKYELIKCELMILAKNYRVKL